MVINLSRAGMILALAFVVGLANEVQAAAPGGALRIGMISTLFQDTPEQYLAPLSKRFTSIVKEKTGVSSTMALAPDARTLAKQITDGTVHLGVFQGFEFAWVMKEYPDLVPLAVAVPLSKTFQALLIVRSDCDAKAFADLSGKTIVYPTGNRAHCRLYLERSRLGVDGTLTECNLTDAPSVGDALEDVVDGKADATVVDQGALESFTRVRSGRAAKLKVIDASEVFPLSVVVYHKGTLSPSVLTQFRNGLTNVHTSRDGQFMMRLWKLSRFATVPADYAAQLGNILKAYPPTE